MDPVLRRVEAAVVRPLRRAVLRPGSPDEELVYAGDDDPDAGHVAAYIGDEVAGIASVTRQPYDGVATAWRLRGMATAPAARGTGLGALLLAACVDHVAEHGGTLLWCNARTPALGFYERFGFEAAGEEFDIPGIGPHYVMRRTVDP